MICPRCDATMHCRKNPFFGVGLAVHEDIASCPECDYYELKVSASREAWIGFVLLTGTGDNPDRARRLLKLGRPGDVRKVIWGATWDLMYTRLPGMAESAFRGQVKLPLVFVTDDFGLIDALAGIIPAFNTENAHGVEIIGDEFNVEALHEDARPIVRGYINRERRRVLLHSKGMTRAVMTRAAYLARVSEGQLAADL
jgi:hypothetical protein